GFAAAVAGLKAGGHADLLVVRRGQAEHDLAAGDEFGRVGVRAQQRVVVFHEDSSLSFSGSRMRPDCRTIDLVSIILLFAPDFKQACQSGLQQDAKFSSNLLCIWSKPCAYVVRIEQKSRLKSPAQLACTDGRDTYREIQRRECAS